MTRARIRTGIVALLVLSGHRDTHFAFLRDVMLRERLVLERTAEAPREYRVREMRVVDYRDIGALLAGRVEGLVLVTCWPFDAIAAGGVLRLVVFAHVFDGDNGSAANAR